MHSISVGARNRLLDTYEGYSKSDHEMANTPGLFQIHDLATAASGQGEHADHRDCRPDLRVVVLRTEYSAKEANFVLGKPPSPFAVGGLLNAVRGIRLAYPVLARVCEDCTKEANCPVCRTWSTVHDATAIFSGLLVEAVLPVWKSRMKQMTSDVLMPITRREPRRGMMWQRMRPTSTQIVDSFFRSLYFAEDESALCILQILEAQHFDSDRPQFEQLLR